MKKWMIGLAALTLTAAASSVFAKRNNIMIVGSSTVFPFSKVVAERFGRGSNGKFKAPKVEPTGTGGGFKEFCKGVGPSNPDVANASRRIKSSEYTTCKKNGVDIVEVHIGYDGIVIANSVKGDPMSLTLKDVYLALAKKVPDPNSKGQLIDNPYTTWKDVNAKLAAKKITVLGPPPTSGTRDAFVELAMEGGCNAFDWIAALKKSDKNRYKAICHGIREDGAFVTAGENDNVIVRKLNESKDSLGIFGFSFLDQNADKVKAATIDGHEPTFESIADGDYIISRPLYFYVKKNHIDVIPGIKEFLGEFISDAATGEEGYLTDKGLIPLSGSERATVVANVKSLKSLTL